LKEIGSLNIHSSKSSSSISLISLTVPRRPNFSKYFWFILFSQVCCYKILEYVINWSKHIIKTWTITEFSIISSKIIDFSKKL
jgi:hypothetical protein